MNKAINGCNVANGVYELLYMALAHGERMKSLVRYGIWQSSNSMQIFHEFYDLAAGVLTTRMK